VLLSAALAQQFATRSFLASFSEGWNKKKR